MLINTQALRNKILTLAVQGKLVPQDQADGTAEELYQKIRKHHKKITPCKSKLDFTSMDFDIPNTWAMVELNQLFNFVDYRGKTPHKISQGIFLITASNIRQGVMDYTRKEYISPQEYEQRKSRGITAKGDLLFTTEAPMGNVALCDLDICSCGQRIITFKEYEKETVIPKLYMYFILSPVFQRQLLDNCTGTTAKGIKADKLKHFLIPLPPLAEQKRIVEKVSQAFAQLDKIDALQAQYQDNLTAFCAKLLKLAIHGELSAKFRRENVTQNSAPTVIASKRCSRGNLLTMESTAFDEIATYNAKIAKIKGQRETLLLQIEKQHKSEKNAHRKARLKTLSGSLKNKIKTYRTITPLNQNPEFTPPFDIPKEWAWVKLGEICEIVRGGSPRPIENYLTNSENGLNWIKIGDTDIGGKYIRKTAQKITKDGLHKTRFVKAGSLLLTNSMSFGRPYILEIDGCIHDGWLVLSKFQNLATIDFLFNLLTCGYVQKSFRETVAGAVVKNLSTEKVQETIIPLPPLAEQKFIAGQLEKLLDLCKKLKTKP